MYDGKQVLRFVNNYKTKDLYLLGNEMNKRIGTGNYDSERTKFNVHYKDINKSNLYQEVKSILEDRDIEYSHKTKTNILNGVTFTSGPEFFMTLGLPFKETDRIYQSGDKKAQKIGSCSFRINRQHKFVFCRTTRQRRYRAGMSQSVMGKTLR